jgi:flagellar M-ring protein FliF
MATGTQLEKSAPAGPGQPQLADRLAGLWGRARVRWAQMQPAQRGWALVAAMLLAALAGGLLWYALRTDWRTLYADLDPEDARQIGQILAQAQIPFEPTPMARDPGSGRATGQGAPGDRGQGRRQERAAGI